MSTPDRTGVKETCRILNSSNPAHFPPPNLPNHVMPGPDRVSSQHDLTGSCETYHEHQCPTSQPARVETYHQCVLYIHTAPCYTHMPPRYCGDAACCVSTQRPCNRTTTTSPDYKILLRRRMSAPQSNTRCPEQTQTLPINVMPAKADASGATDAVNPGSTT